MISEKRLKELVYSIKNKNNKSLSSIFELLAKKWKLKKNSVRNIYYLIINRAINDSDFAKKINLNIKDIEKNKIIPFSKIETDKLIYEINNKLKQGKSVRSACNELANGNVALMLRYQNKYRSITKNNISYAKNAENKNNLGFIKLNKNIKSCSNNVNKISFAKLNKTDSLSNNKNNFSDYDIPENCIPFRKKETSLSDGELQSLFMGLLRIVRNSAVADVNNALKEQYNLQAIKIRNLLKNLSKLNEELNESKRENNKLLKEIELIKTNKVKRYESFINNLTNENINNDEIKK